MSVLCIEVVGKLKRKVLIVGLDCGVCFNDRSVNGFLKFSNVILVH